MGEGLTAGAAARPQAAPRRGRWIRRLLLFSIWILLLYALAAYAHYYIAAGQFIETTDDAYVGGDVTDIAANVSGEITGVDVVDNQVVHKGDLLVKIDDRGFVSALKRAAAAVAVDQASLANLDAQTVLQNDIVAQGQADVAAAAAAAAFALDTKERYERLEAGNAASVQDMQNAEDAYAQAEAACDKAAAALAAAKAQLAVIASERREKQAALAEALVDVDMAEVNLGYTEIRAPFDGVVGNRSARLGGYAEAGAQLLTIVPSRGLWVDANFKENQLRGIRPGMAAEIVPDVDTGVRLTGRVVSLAPASGSVFSLLPAENATGNFTKIVQRVPVRIALSGDDAALGLLRPGLSVTVTVDTR